MADPRVWTVDDPNNPTDPWVWGENAPDPVTLRIATDPNAARHYILEPALDEPGSWAPEGTSNIHPFSYWLVDRFDPLTEVPAE